MQTTSYASITNALSNLPANVTPPGELLDEAVVATRIARDQPDFAPVATLSRGLLDHAGNVVASGHTNLSPKTRGTLAIGSSVQDITVTGLGLKFTPIGVLLSVIHATSGKTEIRAFPVGAPTADGFVCHLSGSTGDGTYILAFQLF